MIDTEVMVASAQKDLLTERMKICSVLWDADIKAEMAYKQNPRLLNQFQYCEREGIPFQVLVGEEELKVDSVKIRDAETKEEVSCGLVSSARTGYISSSSSFQLSKQCTQCVVCSVYADRC